MITLTTTKPVSTKDIIHAIELACSPVLGALNLANALGGLETDPWRLVRGFTLAQLIDEAVEHGVDLSTVKAACCDVLVFDTPPFHAALGYDPRPRCTLCNRRHVVDKRRPDAALSCGATIHRFSMPEKHWTRATAEAAVEGRYP